MAFSESPIVGFGLGGSKSILLEKYEQINSFDNLEMQNNSHNQFLQELLYVGTIGFLIFISAVCYPLFLFRNSKLPLLYVLFLIIFFTACLSESILERQKGIIFYAFFNSILYHHFSVQLISTTQNKPNPL